MKKRKKKRECFTDFMIRFSTDQKCLEHLVALKWEGGYLCRKCGHDQYVKGRRWHNRKCQHCKYDESATAHTLFHKVKFPLTKAFGITYQVSTMKKCMSSCELSFQWDIHQETAWYFKRKAQQAMSLGDRPLLEFNVEVDETVIGGRESGKPGRSHGKKKKVLVGIEVEYPEGDGAAKIKRASAVVIDDYSAESLGKGINEIVDEDALVTTDGWGAYQKATGGRMHMSFPSEDGENFKLLHWHIFNIKNWVRGIHHWVSSEHMQTYLDEFHYRFNRRNSRLSNVHSVLKRMVKSEWEPRVALAGDVWR